MIYVLHVFEAPMVKDPASAVFAVDRGRATASRGRLAGFTKALLQTYPDQATLTALGRTGERPVWTQDRIEPAGDGVFVLEIESERLTGNLLQTIAYAAADQGLFVLDRKQPLLYCGHHVVFPSGSTKPVAPPVAPEDAPPFKEPFPPAEAIRKLVSLTASRQSTRGFAAYLEGEHKYAWCAWRDRGEVRQAIEFTASWDQERALFWIGAYFHFAHPYLWAALERHAPRWAGGLEHNRRTLGPAFGTLWGNAHDFFADARSIMTPHTFADVKPAAIDEWGLRFNQWLETSAMPQLDAAHDLAGLSRLVFSNHRRDRVEQSQWPLMTLATTLFLLRRRGASANDDAIWWPLLEIHAGLATRYPLKRAADDSERMVAEEILAAIERLRDPGKEA